MHFTASEILAMLDQCDESFTFPMLDNGYVYLAANRLSLYRSRSHWAMVIEIFGFSPRPGRPDFHIATFADHLRDRNNPQKYVSIQAYEQYLARKPYNESRFFYPIEEGDWQDSADRELIAKNATQIMVRGKPHPIPALDAYTRYGIELERPPRVNTFELCRLLAAVARDDVLATPEERRVSVLPHMIEILRLEAWHHPDIAAGEPPSSSQTFQQLTDVLMRGAATNYQPTQPIRRIAFTTPPAERAALLDEAKALYISRGQESEIRGQEPDGWRAWREHWLRCGTGRMHGCLRRLPTKQRRTTTQQSTIHHPPSRMSKAMPFTTCWRSWPSG